MSQKFIGITLPIRLGQTGMFEQSTTVIQQVRSNFKNLILTKKGERIYQPELGCDLWKVLFEPTSEDINELAKISVVDALEKWMPFIEIVEFDVRRNDSGYSFVISSTYRFRNNPNVTDSIVITLDNAGSPTQNSSAVFATPRRKTQR